MFICVVCHKDTYQFNNILVMCYECLDALRAKRIQEENKLD